MKIVEEKTHDEFIIRFFISENSNYKVMFFYKNSELESFVYDSGSTGEWQARNTFALIDRTVQFMLAWAKEKEENDRKGFGCAPQFL